MHVVMLGPFGLHPKATMLARALPAARALAGRGHRVTLVMPPWHTPAEAGQAWDDQVAGVRLEYVSLAGLRLPGAGHGVVAARMARRAVALAPEVIHAFKPKAYSGLAASLLRGRQRAGAPWALVVDTDDWEGPGGWNELEPYGPLQRRFFAWQERWGLRHADGVTVASRALEALTWALGVPAARVTYVPNALGPGSGAVPGLSGVAPGLSGVAPGLSGVAPGLSGVAPGDGRGVPAGAIDEARRPGVEAPDTDTPTLLLYTRFFEFDLGRPLDVLARVREREPAARLVVAGRGLFGEEERFLELARGRGLADAVEYRGWIEPEAAPALFAAADVALYPFDDSLVNRTKSSVKLLELLGAGLPVVAEAVGQNREVIEDGRSGRLVPPGDVAAFADAVAGLLADDAGRLAMGRAARARVASAFSWDRRVDDLEAAYAAAQLRAAGRCS